MFLGVQDFTDGRRGKCFWAYRILRMDVEENLFGRAGFYGWTQKKIFLGVQDFTDGRRRKSFWAYSILLTVDRRDMSL